ncbi:energy transducer TonB [Desulfovibrio cuneatus]|uniref:energy transducer TonB n=1 Tax=Desulfovibrio cuneatus TaxID=159728 RepID=UPI0003FCD829|nr:energy transducer TonB [Desulfovibrio cuneatus]
MAFAKEKAKTAKPKAVLTPQMQEAVKAYGDIFAQRLRQEWRLPPRANRRKLQAVVMVVIAKDGQIKETTLVEPSGDRLFDSSLMHALKHVGGLPPTPGNKEVNIATVFEL